MARFMNEYPRDERIANILYHIDEATNAIKAEMVKMREDEETESGDDLSQWHGGILYGKLESSMEAIGTIEAKLRKYSA